MSLIEFENVTLLRKDRAALHELSLKICEGEHVAILGPNGSGKSSLIKTITRECYPMQGSSVKILGRSRWNIFELRPKLGIVSNDWMLACTRDYSGRETILSGFFSSVGIWPHHLVTPEMESRAGAILALLEISHLAGRFMSEMSSGEARRFLIGRALVHSPSAIIFDEPTNSLDFRATHELREVLRKLAAMGTSIILVTHNLADLIPEIERVVLIKEGRIFRDGPKAEVLTSAALSQLFNMPVELVVRDGYFHIW
jgi:iron complex transport system ATP-binding protein